MPEQSSESLAGGPAATVGAIVVAAGRSERMGGLDKILASADGLCSHNRAVLSYWPYRADRADIRSNVYVLMAMKLMDVITGATAYQQRQRYQDLAAWLTTMRDEQGFLEYENCHDGTRGSHASPAQFLVCYWVSGTYKWD